MYDEGLKTLAAAIIDQAVVDYRHGLSGKYTGNYSERLCNPKYLKRWFDSPYAATLLDLAGIDKDYFIEWIMKIERIVKHA